MQAHRTRRDSRRDLNKDQQQQSPAAHDARFEGENVWQSLLEELHEVLGNERATALQARRAQGPQDLYLTHLLHLAARDGFDYGPYLPWRAPTSWMSSLLPYYRVLWAEERAAREGAERVPSSSTRTDASPPGAAAQAWELASQGAPHAAGRALLQHLLDELPSPPPAPPAFLVQEALTRMLEGRADRVLEQVVSALHAGEDHDAGGPALGEGADALLQALAAVQGELQAGNGLVSAERTGLLLGLTGVPESDEVDTFSGDFAPYPEMASSLSGAVGNLLWSDPAVADQAIQPVLAPPAPGAQAGSGPAMEGGASALRLEREPSQEVPESGSIEARIRRSRGRGLAANLIRRLEAVMQRDLSAVRVHTDSAAARASEDLQARAFTIGEDIYFGEGMWAPGTPQGDELLLHELTHVAQYEEGRLPASGGEGIEVSHPSDPIEQEAEGTAQRLASQLDPLSGPLETSEPGPMTAQNPVGPDPTGIGGEMTAPEASGTGFASRDGGDSEGGDSEGSGESGTGESGEDSGEARGDESGDAEVVAILAEEMQSGGEERARQMLQDTPPAQRGTVRQAIRQSFDEDEAQEIIDSVEGEEGQDTGGQEVPEVTEPEGEEEGDPDDTEAEGEDAEEASEDGEGEGEEGSGEEGDGDGTSSGEGGDGDAHADPVQRLEVDLDVLESGDLDLIHQELVEHQRWSSAGAAVGEAGSSDRAAWITEQVGEGAISGAASGFGIGFAAGVVGQLAARYVPIPGVGAILAGSMAAYGLITRDWSATADTISQFGEGGSTYEVLANSIASVSEIIDLAVNILNVVAGIIGIISAVMWIVTIVTAGVASPLAGTLSSIALGITAATGILDNINNMVLQPCVMLFRALHAFQDESDPREVEEQGRGLTDAASKSTQALGGWVGGKAGSAVGTRAANTIDSHAASAQGPSIDAPTTRGSGGDAPTTRGDTPDAPTARGDTPDTPTTRGDTPDTPSSRGDTPDSPTSRGDTPESPSTRTDAEADLERVNQVDDQLQTQHRRGWSAVREEFRLHRQRMIDLELRRRQQVQDAEETAYNRRLDEIEAERVRRNEEIDRRTRNRHDDVEARRADVEQTARQKAHDEFMSDRQAAHEARMAAYDELEVSTTRARNQADDMRTQQQQAVDRDYMDQRLLEMMDWRQRQVEIGRIEDPDIRQQVAENWEAQHNQRLQQLESQYDADCNRITREWSDEVGNVISNQQDRMQRIQQDYDDAVGNAQAKHDQTLQDAQNQLQQQHDDVDAEAGTARDQVNQDAENRVNEPFEERNRAGEDARNEYGDQYAKDVADATAGLNPSGGIGKVGTKIYSESTKKEVEAEPGQSQHDARQEAHDARFTPDNRNGPDRPDSAETYQVVNTDRVNPDYEDPPADPAQLDAILLSIEDLLDQRAQAQQAEEEMSVQESEASADQPGIDQVVQQNQQSIDVGAMHEQAVARRQAANQQQQQRRQESEGLVSGYPSRAAGLSVISIPLEAFKGFTWIASKLPGSAGSAMESMHEDAEEFSEALSQMDGQMEEQAESQPELQQQLQDDQGRLDQTAEEGAETTSTLEESAEGAQNLSDANQENVDAATTAREEAAQQGATLESQVDQQEQQYETTKESLLAWAIDHRQARQDAIAEQQANTSRPRDFGSDL